MCGNNVLVVFLALCFSRLHYRALFLLSQGPQVSLSRPVRYQSWKASPLTDKTRNVGTACAPVPPFSWRHYHQTAAAPPPPPCGNVSLGRHSKLGSAGCWRGQRRPLLSLISHTTAWCCGWTSISIARYRSPVKPLCCRAAAVIFLTNHDHQ